MEFLKELFADGKALTYDELSAAVEEKGFSVVNAAGGAYVPKTQHDAVTAQLREANEKLTGYDPEWKAKSDALEQKLTAMQFDHALEKAIAAAKPRNAKAVYGLIDRDKLKFAGGEIIGLDAQLNALRSGADTAFLFEDKPKTGMSHQNNGAGGADTSAANDALRAIFRGGK